jgi:hypothetical protein
MFPLRCGIQLELSKPILQLCGHFKASSPIGFHKMPKARFAENLSIAVLPTD